MSELQLQLRHVNRILDTLLDTLAESPHTGLGFPHDRLTRAFTEILRVEATLRSELQGTDATSLGPEIQDYRDRLARVRNLMPSLHARLLTERARLEAERSHLEAASAWADASKNAT